MKDSQTTIEKLDEKITTLSSTVDELAEAVSKGFTETQRRIDGVEDRINAVEKNLGKRIDSVESSLNDFKSETRETLNTLMNGMDKFFQRFEEREHEIIVMKTEPDQIKKAHKEKLGINIKALM